jgi:hypothetical protein
MKAHEPLGVCRYLQIDLVVLQLDVDEFRVDISQLMGPLVVKVLSWSNIRLFF